MHHTDKANPYVQGMNRTTILSTFQVHLLQCSKNIFYDSNLSNEKFRVYENILEIFWLMTLNNTIGRYTVK